MRGKPAPQGCGALRKPTGVESVELSNNAACLVWIAEGTPTPALKRARGRTTADRRPGPSRQGWGLPKLGRSVATGTCVIVEIGPAMVARLCAVEQCVGAITPGGLGPKVGLGSPLAAEKFAVLVPPPPSC